MQEMGIFFFIARLFKRILNFFYFQSVRLSQRMPYLEKAV